MKILLRADASATSGTGHVMRVLTLAEELVNSGNDVHLATNASGVEWLEDRIRSVPVVRHTVNERSLEENLVREIGPDWLVVDSYDIDAEAISSMRRLAKVLAIVDGDSRGIQADLYLDHNIGADTLSWPESVASHMLAGSRYALIRLAIRDVRRDAPWKLPAGAPKLIAFMGGTDPTGMILNVAQAIASSELGHHGTIICNPRLINQVREIVRGQPNLDVIEPTAELPRLLANADIAISAAGTSSWELCTLGIPSVLIEVVDNQTESLREMNRRGVVIGLSPADFTDNGFQIAVTHWLDELSTNESTRRRLSDRCLETFDGQGAQRVVEAMTNFQTISSSKPS